MISGFETSSRPLIYVFKHVFKGRFLAKLVFPHPPDFFAWSLVVLGMYRIVEEVDEGSVEPDEVFCVVLGSVLAMLYGCSLCFQDGAMRINCGQL